MLRLRRAAVVILGLLFALTAQADDEPVSLDSADTGKTVDQDTLDTGRTHGFDSVDSGQTTDLDSLDKGRTKSLDAADKGSTVDQDTIDTGTTESLSAAERAPAAAPKPPAPLPRIADDELREQAQAARDALVDAEHRATAADAAYSEMRAHDFPRGDAAAAIVKEYEASHTAYAEARTRYEEIIQ